MSRVVAATPWRRTREAEPSLVPKSIAIVAAPPRSPNRKSERRALAAEIGAL